MKIIVLGADVTDAVVDDPEFEVVAVGDAAEGVCQACARLDPRVIVVHLDAAGPTPADLELVTGLRRASRAAVVVSAGCCSAECVRRLLVAGATAFVVHGAPPDAVNRAVHAAAAGEFWVSDAVRPDLFREVAESIRRAAKGAVGAPEVKPVVGAGHV